MCLFFFSLLSSVCVCGGGGGCGSAISLKLIKDFINCLTDFFISATYTLLFSEHLLCKESIAVVKKFDFEILTFLYVFKSSEFIYAIFYGDACAYVCLYVCVYVRVYVSM